MYHPKEVLHVDFNQNGCPSIRCRSLRCSIDYRRLDSALPMPAVRSNSMNCHYILRREHNSKNRVYIREYEIECGGQVVRARFEFRVLRLAEALSRFVSNTDDRIS